MPTSNMILLACNSFLVHVTTFTLQIYIRYICLCLFLFGYPKQKLENFSFIWRRHHYRWRASNFDLYMALMAIEQWGFFSVPHILWHGTSRIFFWGGVPFWIFLIFHWALGTFFNSVYSCSSYQKTSLMKNNSNRNYFTLNLWWKFDWIWINMIQ